MNKLKKQILNISVVEYKKALELKSLLDNRKKDENNYEIIYEAGKEFSIIDNDKLESKELRNNLIRHMSIFNQIINNYNYKFNTKYDTEYITSDNYVRRLYAFKRFIDNLF